jgi:solute:Na+ symporter, SSS family
MLITAVILYFLITLLIGFAANRKIANTGDFINTGRNLHPVVNTAALFALWFGSETIFGASSEFADSGFLGVIEDPFGGVLCLLIVGLVYSRKLYRHNVYTIGDIFRKHYGVRIEYISSLLMIVSFFGYAGAQMVALGLIVQVLTGLGLGLSMLLSAMVVIVYTFTGGMWAVSLTDFVQSILIVTGLVVIAWMITGEAGSPQKVIQSIPDEHLRFFPDGGALSWVNWFAAWMVLGVGSVVSQDIFQRVNSARSENAAYYSTLAGAGIYLVLAMLPLYLVAAIRIIDPTILEGDLQLALPVLVQQTMPEWVQILFFGSLLSAIMSTCSGALLAPASLLSENILKHNYIKNLNEKQSLRLTRFCVLIVGVISLGMAFGSQNIFHLVGEASIFGLVSIFVPFTAALFFNHKSVKGALTSMIAGTLVWALFNYIIEIPVEALVPGFIASLIGLWAGTAFDRDYSNEKNSAFRA